MTLYKNVKNKCENIQKNQHAFKCASNGTALFVQTILGFISGAATEVIVLFDHYFPSSETVYLIKNKI